MSETLSGFASRARSERGWWVAAVLVVDIAVAGPVSALGRRGAHLAFDYDLYRYYFPVWALGAYRAHLEGAATTGRTAKPAVRASAET